MPQMLFQSSDARRPRASAETRLAASPITSTFRMTASCNPSDARNAALPGPTKRVMRWRAPACGAGTADHPSQRRRLSEDPVAHVPVHFSVPTWTLIPSILEILHQPGVIQQTPARLPRHQQIEAAVLIGFTAGHRAEYAQSVGAAPLGEPEDLFPPLRSQRFQGDYVSIVRQLRAAIVLARLTLGRPFYLSSVSPPEARPAQLSSTTPRPPAAPASCCRSHRGSRLR